MGNTGKLSVREMFEKNKAIKLQPDGTIPAHMLAHLPRDVVVPGLHGTAFLDPDKVFQSVRAFNNGRDDGSIWRLKLYEALLAVDGIIYERMDAMDSLTPDGRMKQNLKSIFKNSYDFTDKETIKSTVFFDTEWTKNSYVLGGPDNMTAKQHFELARNAGSHLANCGSKTAALVLLTGSGGPSAAFAAAIPLINYVPCSLNAASTAIMQLVQGVRHTVAEMTDPTADALRIINEQRRDPARKPLPSLTQVEFDNTLRAASAFYMHPYYVAVMKSDDPNFRIKEDLYDLVDRGYTGNMSFMQTAYIGVMAREGAGRPGKIPQMHSNLFLPYMKEIAPNLEKTVFGSELPQTLDPNIALPRWTPPKPR